MGNANKIRELIRGHIPPPHFLFDKFPQSHSPCFDHLLIALSLQLYATT